MANKIKPNIFPLWRLKQLCDLWNNQQKIIIITLCHWKAYIYLWLEEVRLGLPWWHSG